jgi:hypothetical protein
MTQQVSMPADVDYATALPARPASRTLAGALLLFGGLGLIVIAGCFLIGILITIQHIGFGGAPVQQLPLSPAEMVFVAVLSALALAALGGGVLLLYLGTRALLRITMS